MKQKLSLNERKVLKHLINNSRINRTEIARDVGITSQAVGKIEKKLEKTGVIKGYTAVVDNDKLGIEVFAIALFKFKSGSWTRLEKEDIKSRVNGPHLINVYRFKEGDITHMVVYGFRNLREVDNYFHNLQTERGHISELIKVYTISSDSVLKQSINELLLKVLKEYDDDTMAKPEPPQPFK